MQTFWKRSQSLLCSQCRNGFAKLEKSLKIQKQKSIMILFRCFSISSLFSITDSFPPSKYIQVNHTFITVSHHQVRTFSSQKLTTKSFCIFFQLSNASLLNQNIASLALLFLVPCSAATLLSVLRNLKVTWVFIIIFLW